MTENEYVWTHGHRRKHHLSPECPYVEPDADRKERAIYPELDLCSWCETRLQD